MSGVDPAFWNGRRVLVTGHTGFKGAWLAAWLVAIGADVTGFSRGPVSEPSLFALAGLGEHLRHELGDIRDPAAVDAIVAAAKPEVIIHMAAQPMVRRSFVEPQETYATNVMGTVNVLDAVRRLGGDDVRAIVSVTSDKCYDNFDGREPRPFVETDPMGGHDPYSNSKGCAELVSDAYRRSYFTAADQPARVASVRAGNVIGGGDWGEDRLIPDMMRGAASGTPIAIRNPTAVRPWQHVLNPLSGYLLVAERLCGEQRDAVARGWNFGPSADDVQPVSWVVEQVSERWPDGLSWEIDPGPHPHEAAYLALDSGLAAEQLGWTPAWDLAQTVNAIVDWHVAVRDGEDALTVTNAQIAEFTAA